MDALNKAIKKFGGVKKLAKELDVTHQAILKWKRRGVPAKRVLRLVQLMDGEISPHDLRDDIYPDPTWNPYRRREQSDENAA